MRAAWIVLLGALLTGCVSDREFGWQSGWGGSFDPDRLAGRDAEVARTLQKADSLRLAWTDWSELAELALLYEEVLAHAQNRTKQALEEYYAGLEPPVQEIFGPAERQPDETADQHEERQHRRYLSLRDASKLPFDEHLYDLYWKLANTYYFMADGLQADEELAQKLHLHEQGLHHGERALDCFPSFRKAIRDGVEEEVAVTRIGVEGLAGVYWTTVNLSRWARLKGLSFILFHRTKAKAMIEHIRATEPEWYYGAADRYLGTYYAVAPSIAGGSLALSREHFDRALEIEPAYLGTHVLVAEFYATKMQDRALFESELQFALDAPVDTLKDIIPLQRIEQEKARKLLARADEWF